MKVTDKVIGLEFWNQNPRELEELEQPKELTNNDIMTLRYVAQELVCTKVLPYEGTNLISRDTVEQEASVCQDALYLGNFEGYRVDESSVLRSVFLNKDNRLIAEVWTGEDSYKHYLIY